MMPTLPIRRPRCTSKLATFALTLTLFCLATSDASAQFAAGYREYSRRFYGQDFYDHQRPGRFTKEGYRRQNFGPIYGPAEIYGRQYGDENGYATARPFVRRRVGGPTGYGGNSL